MCVEGGFFFSKSVCKHDFTFIREMRETLEGSCSVQPIWQTKDGLVSGRLQVKKFK
jgi:hypothetical protein